MKAKVKAKSNSLAKVMSSGWSWAGVMALLLLIGGVAWFRFMSTPLEINEIIGNDVGGWTLIDICGTEPVTKGACQAGVMATGLTKGKSCQAPNPEAAKANGITKAGCRAAAGMAADAGSDTPWKAVMGGSSCQPGLLFDQSTIVNNVARDSGAKKPVNTTGMHQCWPGNYGRKHLVDGVWVEWKVYQKGICKYMTEKAYTYIDQKIITTFCASATQTAPTGTKACAKDNKLQFCCPEGKTLVNGACS